MPLKNGLNIFCTDNGERKVFIGIIGVMSVKKLFALLIIIIAMHDSET